MEKKESSEPSWIKKLVFGVAATVAFYAGVELALLAFGVKPLAFIEDPYVGFSSRMPLFVEERDEDGGSWMATAPNKLAFFNPQRFSKEKRTGSYRVFCVGGSTTYGRPYGDDTSFCGWLRELLPAADPSRDWDVINAGGISYASYRVALLMEELAGYDPDLFVVYSGHNEFLERRTYGAMLEAPSIVSRLDRWLGRSRTYSVIKRTLKAAAPPTGPGTGRDLLPAEVETLLDRSVGPEAYHRDDALRDKTLLHYRFNLLRMVDIARSAGAELFLVAPGSNLADCSPFKSEHRGGLSAVDLATWERGMEAAAAAHREGRNADALAAVDRILALDERHAGALYLRGRVLQALGYDDEARQAFIRSRDEDVCPLRALTPMHEIVQQVAAERSVPAIDFAALVARRAPRGLPGADSFLDHVHPTVESNRLLALEILEHMHRAGIVRPGALWGEEAVRRVTAAVEGRIDRAAEARALRNLANVLTWAGKIEEAERLALQATELEPGDAAAQNQLGLALADRGAIAEAEVRFRRALELEEGFPEAHNNLGVILEDRGEVAAAVAHYARAARERPDYVEAQDNLALGLMRLGRSAEARRALEQALHARPDDVRARSAMATLSAEEGDLEEAARQLELGLRLDPTSTELQNNLGVVRFRQGRVDEAVAHFEAAIRTAPDDPEGHNNLGVALEHGGDFAGAEQAYERALAADPEHVGAQANLALIQRRLAALAAVAR